MALDSPAVRLLVATVLAVAAAGLALFPTDAPLAVLAALATTAWPLAAAWRGAAGTALRPAVVWAALALAAGLLSQVLAWAEAPGSGRPLAGQLVYIMVLLTFAALVSVLNARRPGNNAWAILMALLVVVFLLPWLEGPGLARKAHGLGRLRLDAPWTIFYGLVVIAGVTNYLPTRYGPAACWLLLGLVLEYVLLTRDELRLTRGARLWPAVPWTLAAAVWTAAWRSRRPARAASDLEAAWLWFRDHWGVVWALRIAERFNRTAESLGWPFRLGWFGVVPLAAEAADPPAPGPLPAAAATTLTSLLRRFANPERINAVAASGRSDPCQLPDVG
jgi:hypothetical protein